MIALARPSILRLVRTPRAWIPVALWIALVVVYAAVLRVVRAESPTDRILLGVHAPIVLPLLVLSILSGMTGPDGLRSMTRRMQALGAKGARAAIATVLAGALVCALFAGVTSLVAIAIAHGSGDPSLGHDLATTIWVTALGGATYAAYFSAGATFGPSGSGRGVVLVASWMLADAGTAGAALSPHAHVRSLLGGPQAGTLSQRASSIALVVLFAISLAICAWRCRKRAP